MMYSIKRIGIFSAMKIGGILSALLIVVPIMVFLGLNSIFKFWDVIIPPELLIQGLASTAFWAAIWGGISTGIVAFLYNVSAHFFGGVKVELKMLYKPLDD
jgi:hypothetical protein